MSEKNENKSQESLPCEPERSPHEPWSEAWFGFSDEDRAAVDELRSRLAEADAGLPPAERVSAAEGAEDDLTLVRFVRARPGDLDAAERMLRDARRWRAGVRAHRVLEEVPPNKDLMFKAVPQMQHGFDREGHPIFFHHTGRMHVDELVRFSVESLLECHVWQQENALQACREASDRFGTPVSSFSVFMDLGGLGLSHRKTLHFMKFTAFMDSWRYPEMMKNMVLFNAPTIAPMFWNLVRPFLDKRTQDKIVIIGHDYRDELLRLVPPRHLPREYGGECTCGGDGDGDGDGDGKPCLADPTPEEVAEAMEAYRDSAPDTEELRVASRSVETVALAVDGPATVLYRWQLAAKDVDFRAEWHAKGADEAVQVEGAARVDTTHLSPFFGFYEADGPGEFRLVFDNSFSRFTAKEVRYVLRAADQADAA